MITSFRGYYDFLSNFYVLYEPVVLPEEWDNLEYHTVEHAFQASKTVLLHERMRIHACTTPGQAKRAGRKVTLRDNWEHIKHAVMLDLVEQKFNKCPRLKAFLVSTKDEFLQEGNDWGDTYWGVCHGMGKNKLGHILMNVRAEIVARDSLILLPGSLYELITD